MGGVRDAGVLLTPDIQIPPCVAYLVVSGVRRLPSEGHLLDITWKSRRLTSQSRNVVDGERAYRTSN